MKRGEELELDVQGFAFEGKSVARMDGLVIFLQGAVPGDRVRARLTRVKKSFCEASVLEVLHPSDLRRMPRCRYFGTCGGCKWQQVDYAAQLAFKRQHVVDALERIGGLHGVTVRPTLGAEHPYYYRNKMEFSFGQRWRTAEEMRERSEAVHEDTSSEWALGLHTPGRFDRVLDLDECFLQSDLSAQIVNEVRRFCRERRLSVYSTRSHTGYLRNLVIRQSKRTGELMVNLVTRDDRSELMSALSDHLVSLFPAITTVCNNITERKSQVALGEREIVYHGNGTITERIGSRTYRISANSFFQTNTEQAERLYNTIRDMAQLRPEDLVFDLYSGTGTIALHIASEVSQVVGIESVESAVEDARRNAVTNDVSNCHFILGDLRETLTRREVRLSGWRSPSVMIIDPPRAGMHEDVLRGVIEIAPERIVYVSCNPTTQARDLALLSVAYRILDAQPVDMFPHTYHIENVVSLSR